MSIDAKELRIGNLAQDSNNDFCKVTAFNSSTIWVEYLVDEPDRSSILELDIENVFPIATTENLLLRLGFYKNKDLFYIGEIGTYNDGNIWYNNELIVVSEQTHIHTLQNLFFYIKKLTYN